MDKNYITAKLVKEILENNAFLLDYLKRGLINIQALARELLIHIKEKNPKATVESISVAIKRMSFQYDISVTEQLKNILQNVQLTTRNNVVLFCLRKGSSLPSVSDFKVDDIFFVNQGSDEVTIIVDERNINLIKGDILLKQENLAVITLRDSLLHEKKNYRVTPGFVNAFLNNISKQGINVNDILSTYSQVTFVVEQKYLLDVYKICRDVINLEHW